MKSTRSGGAITLVAAASVLLTGCAVNETASTNDEAESRAQTSQLAGTLNGVGSSAQAVAQNAWVSLFMADNPEVTVNYDPQGSGAGRSSFLAGAAHFAGSDVALSSDELDGPLSACAADSTAIDLPVYLSPIALAYNLEGVDDLRLDAATTARIFSGDITFWNDPELVRLNPDAELPEERITVVHRSDDSGTTANFTDYLASQVPDIWGKPAAETFPYAVGDAAKGTSGVADTVRNAAGSIGYLDESGAADLQMAQLKVGDSFVSINAAGAADVVAASPVVDGRTANDMALAIDRGVTSDGAWPLVLVSYAVACQEYDDADTAGLVKSYLTHVISDEAQEAAAEQAGSAPLSDELQQKVSEAIATIR